jgi:hypothetical protein
MCSPASVGGLLFGIVASTVEIGPFVPEAH